jgi:hypothetical protein
MQNDVDCGMRIAENTAEAQRAQRKNTNA